MRNIRRISLAAFAVALLLPNVAQADRRAKNRAEVLSRGRGYY